MERNRPFPDVDRAVLTYKVRYGTTWDSSKQRGKLWGLGGVSASGSKLGKERPPMHGVKANPGDGWSARRTVARGDNQVIDYIYDPQKDRPPYNDNPYGDRAWWGAQGATDGSNGHVDGWWRGEKNIITNGRWYTFTQRIDVDKGLIESYLDGELVAKTTGRPLRSAGADVNALLAHPYIGSKGNPDHIQAKEVWTYFTDIAVTAAR